MIDAYAKLLEIVAETGDKQEADVAVSKLIAHLKSAGRLKMLPQIARELRKVAARRKALEPVVEAASEREGTDALTLAAKSGINAKKVRVNRSLIAGWRAREAGKLVDRSAKSALIEIYKNVTR